MQIAVVDAGARALTAVRPERCTRGNAYLALDCRRQFAIASQTVDGVREAIDSVVGEPTSRTSLYAVAALTQRSGRTGSFTVQRCALADLPARVATVRHRYARLLIAAADVGRWSLVREAHQIILPQSQNGSSPNRSDETAAAACDDTVELDEIVLHTA